MVRAGLGAAKGCGLEAVDACELEAGNRCGLESGTDCRLETAAAPKALTTSKNTGRTKPVRMCRLVANRAPGRRPVAWLEAHYPSRRTQVVQQRIQESIRKPENQNGTMKARRLDAGQNHLPGFLDSKGPTPEDLNIEVYSGRALMLAAPELLLMKE